MKALRASRISATVFHKHKYISNPTVTPEDSVIAAIENLTATLKNNSPAPTFFPLNEITRLITILADTMETTTAHPVKPLQPAPPPKTNLIPPPKCLIPVPLPRVVPVPRVAPPSSTTVTPSRRSPLLAERTPPTSPVTHQHNDD